MLGPQRHIQGVQYAKSIMCLTALTNNMLTNGGGPGGIPLADILCGGMPLGLLYPRYAASSWTQSIIQLADSISGRPISMTVGAAYNQILGLVIGILSFLLKGALPIANIAERLYNLRHDEENLIINLTKFISEWLPKSNLDAYMFNAPAGMSFSLIPMMGLVLNPGNKNLSFTDGLMAS